MNKIKTDENLRIKGFFDNQTSTISYVVHDNIEKKCAVIDSVLDFDYSSGDIDYVNADKIISYVDQNKLNVEWLIETHVHADHLSASPYIQKKLGGKIGISEKISDIQNIFGKTFNAGTEFLSLPGPPGDIYATSSGLILKILAIKFFNPSSSFIVRMFILFLYLPVLKDLTLYLLMEKDLH